MIEVPKHNIMESSTIVDKMLQYHRQEAKTLVKKYTGAYCSRLMRLKGLRKILWNSYQI